MIDINFVKTYDPADVARQDYMEEQTLLNDFKSAMAMLESKIEDYNMFEAYKFESFTGDKISMNEYIKEEASNVFEKIGAAIARIINSIVERLKNIRTHYKAKKVALMKKEEQLGAFLHAHPEIEEDTKLKERLRVAIENGAINLSDINQIQNYLKNADELIKDIDKGSVDEKSFKGRMEKLKSNGIKRAGQVVAIAAGVGTIIKTVNEINKLRKKAENNTLEMERALNKNQKKLDILKAAFKDPNSNVKEHASKIGMKCSVYSEVNKALGEETSMCFKAFELFGKVADMIVGKTQSDDKIKARQQKYIGQETGKARKERARRIQQSSTESRIRRAADRKFGKGGNS